jgi:PAS domain S-box-containing protein
MTNNVRNKPAAFSIRLLIAGVLAFIGFYVLSRNDYLLFHSAVELLGVVVAFSIFIIAWNARRFLANDYLLFVGIGFLFVSILGTMHTLSYRGMGVFEGYEPTNLAAQFWIDARYMQALALLIAPFYIHRRLNTNAAFGAFGIVTALIIGSVLVVEAFPTTFVVGEGLTPFKVGSEFLISGILLCGILMLRRHRDKFSGNVVAYLTAAMAVNIASEMAFTLYTDAYGFLNAVGHFLMIVSIYFIYKALIETGLARPFDLMFHQLKLSEERFEERANELQRFELLSSNSRDIILMVRAHDGRIVEANAAAGAAYGYSRDELLSMNVRDLRAVETQDLAPAQMSEADEKGITFETIHLRRDGGAFPVEVSSRGATIAGARLLLSVIRDITDRKKVEEALKQSETKLRLQLDYILSPETKLVEQDLAAIFDLPVVQSMMDDLYAVTGVGFSIIDLRGNLLVGTGWQNICTEFHRKSPKSCANCIESDLALTRGVKKGEFKTYKCKNNMWDIVTPLYIADRHVGNVFTGQFFFEDDKPDIELFARQADEFGFDKWAYLDALKRVPRHSRKKVAVLMDFFIRFANMISELGYSNLKLAKANADQKQTAETLRQNEQKFRVVADFTHDWEYWREPGGVFQYISPSCEAITGYSQAEFEADATLIARIIHPADRERLTAHLVGADNVADRCEMRFRIIRKDGSERWLGHVCQPVFDAQGKALGRRASNRDITETVLGEYEIARSRRDLEHAQEVARIGNWLMDVKGDVLTWSEESYRIFEVPPGQTMTYERFLACVHPDDRQYVDNNWQAALRRKKHYDIEHRILINGNVKWVREKAELEFDENGSLRGGFGIVHDTTERKKAEQALQQLNAELEGRVEERTHELAAAHTKLLEQLEFRVRAEESLRSLSSRLLSIQEEERRAIARELHDQTGQSLTVLKLMVGRADRIAPKDMKPILKDAGGLIGDIIKQVRGLSLSLRPSVLDDLGLVPAMEWLFKQLQSQADLTVHFEYNSFSAPSSDLSTAVYRIVQEASTNIMRHAGVKEAWVRLMSQESTLSLHIEDRGRGFDTAAASQSTGLSAIRERAALLGGSCGIESSPGKGTIITINLPFTNQNT